MYGGSGIKGFTNHLHTWNPDTPTPNPIFSRRTNKCLVLRRSNCQSWYFYEVSNLSISHKFVELAKFQKFFNPNNDQTNNVQAESPGAWRHRSIASNPSMPSTPSAQGMPNSPSTLNIRSNPSTPGIPGIQFMAENAIDSPINAIHYPICFFAINLQPQALSHWQF